MSGTELAAMTDDELAAALPTTHVFGRVTPQDKLRLAEVMQRGGVVVAMTGDAVNDAAALKKADIGVAMGSGSEVTKQAGKIILTDDNFGTLITAIRLGRGIYDKIVSYIRYQMAKLFSLVLLFLACSIFAINDGVALSPLMVVFQHFFITLFRGDRDHGRPVPAEPDGQATAGSRTLPFDEPELDGPMAGLRDSAVRCRIGGDAARAGIDEPHRGQRADDHDIRCAVVRLDPRRSGDAPRSRIGFDRTDSDCA